MEAFFNALLLEYQEKNIIDELHGGDTLKIMKRVASVVNIWVSWSYAPQIKTERCPEGRS